MFTSGCEGSEAQALTKVHAPYQNYFSELEREEGRRGEPRKKNEK